MELDHSTYACDWCGRHFPRRVQRGRKPLYCRRACRQRAYEERRARRRDPAMRAPLPIFHTRARRDVRPLFEQGGGFGDPYHALRPDGVPDERGRRPTVCGARVHPVPGLFLPGAQKRCAVCSTVASAYPPRWPVRPVVEAPVFRSVILRLADQLGPAADELIDLARVA